MPSITTFLTEKAILSKNFWRFRRIFVAFSEYMNFTFTPQANFPAHNLNFHWKWRWCDQIQATFKSIFYFNYYNQPGWQDCISRDLLHPLYEHIKKELCIPLEWALFTVVESFFIGFIHLWRHKLLSLFCLLTPYSHIFYPSVINFPNFLTSHLQNDDVNIWMGTSLA